MISESQSYSDFGDEDFVGSLLQQATPDQYTNSSSKEQQQKNQMGRRKHCAKKKTRKEKITCENKRMNTNQLEERKPKKQKLNQGDHVPSNKRIFNEQTRIRNSPKWLTLALAALSKDQKKWVIDAGFGSLLKFGIKELPHKLGYFLLTKFDEKNSVLHLPNGDLEVLESDVHDVLGFPHGRLHLELSNQKKNLVDWQDQFPEEKRKKITAKMVSEEIVKTTEVTTLFKYNFLLLLYNTFIKCISHPSICQDMLTFTDIDRTSQYNWCEAVLLNLQQQTTIWKEDPSTKYFNGALVFITLQYVDRVMHNNERVIPRGEPTLIGWTDELLHARQTNESKLGVYGSGVIDHTIRDEMRNRQSIKSKLRMPQLDDEEETESTQPNFKNLKRKLKKAASILKRSKKKFDNILLKCKIRDASDESVKRIERKVSKLFNAQKNNVYQDMPLESDAAMQDTGENHSQEFIGKKDGEEEKGIEAKSNSSGEDRVDQQKDGNEIYSHRNNITKQYQRKSKQTSQSNGDKVSVPKDKNDNSEHWEQRTTEQGQNSTPKEAKKNTGVHPHNEKVQILPLVSQEITSSFLSELSRAIKEQENYTRRGLQFTAEETEKNTPRAITPDGQTLHNTPSSIETVRLGSETDISKDIIQVLEPSIYKERTMLHKINYQ